MPTKEEKVFIDRICQIGCIVCRNNGYHTPFVTPHHINGRTKPGAHKEVIPLCSMHHQVGSADKHWVSRHADGKAAFEKAYGKEEDLLKQCLEIMGEDQIY